MTTKIKQGKFGGGAVAQQVSLSAVLSGCEQIRQEASERRDRYRGGLTAERDSAQSMRAQAKALRRAKAFARRGRQIDLLAILRRKRPDGSPAWALVDPTHEISWTNGHVDSEGKVRLPNGVRIATDTQRKKDFRPSGLPALPPRVREIVTDPKVRRHATFVGVLYQPESWTEVNPDPAVIVAWKALPGKYFALAIWGDDRPAIEEYLS